MKRIAGLVLAGGMVLAAASTADAQVGISIGNPYAGRGVVIGTGGYGYSPYGYGVPATSYYSSGYSGFAAAPVTTYSTTTYGYGMGGYPVYGYGVGGYPAYGYRSYGYGGYPAYGYGRGWGGGFRRWR